MIAAHSPSHAISALRAAIEPARACAVPPLPFGIAPLDDHLATGGLTGSALHEVAAASSDLGDGSAATLFLAGIAARFSTRTRGRVVWALSKFDLHAPGLAQVGLTPERLLFAEAGDDAQTLACMEDALRHGAPAAVIGEVTRADMTASRRLQLAATDGGTPALLLRRWRRGQECPLGELSAATTRWRIGCAPSARLPVAGVGRSRWQVDLVRQRNAPPFSLLLEACDDQGRLALPAAPLHRTVTPERAAARAA
jgi:protein ImuA